MAHHHDDSVLDVVMQLLIENGFDGLADSFRILVNEAMKIERSQVLRAQPHERTPDRLGYANGFKDKTGTTRLGKIGLKVPQVRDGVEFYPSSLERGLLSILQMLGRPISPWREAWAALAAKSLTALAEPPWYASFDTALPMDASVSQIDGLERILTQKLAAMGIKIDRLTPEQRRYLAAWELGT